MSRYKGKGVTSDEELGETTREEEVVVVTSLDIRVLNLKKRERVE